MFEQFLDEIYTRLSNIEWGADRMIYPIYGQPKTEGLPKLIYKIIDPALINQDLGTIMIPQVMIEFESNNESLWLSDLEKFRHAFGDMFISQFALTDQFDSEANQIYYNLVMIVAK